MTTLNSLESIDRLILFVRDRYVMLDADLALLYGVKTKYLNEQVKRNPDRFPEDFMFQLTEEEARSLDRRPGPNGQFRGRRHRPFAFTEPGAGMLASVLCGPAASRIAVEVLRAFKRLRGDEEPSEQEQMDEHGRAIRGLFAAIRDAALFLPGDAAFITDEPYTYFLQAGDDGPIKIGWTKNLLVRLRSLSMMSPITLKLLGVIKGNVEERCHVRLGAFRVHGEWFAPSPAVLDFIRVNAASEIVHQDGV